MQSFFASYCVNFVLANFGCLVDSSGKNSSPVSKVANQSLIDERGFISRLSSPHDYEKTFRNETRSQEQIFYVCMLVNKYYVFFELSLLCCSPKYLFDEQTICHRRKRPNPIRCKTQKNTPRAVVTYTIPQKEKERNRK